MLVLGRRVLHPTCAFTADGSRVPLRSSPVLLHTPAAGRPAENLPSWELPSRGHIPGTARSPFSQRGLAGRDRQRSRWPELPHQQLYYQKQMLASAFKTLKRGGFFKGFGFFFVFVLLIFFFLFFFLSRAC